MGCQDVSVCTARSLQPTSLSRIRHRHCLQHVLRFLTLHRIIPGGNRRDLHSVARSGIEYLCLTRCMHVGERRRFHPLLLSVYTSPRAVGGDPYVPLQPIDLSAVTGWRSRRSRPGGALEGGSSPTQSRRADIGGTLMRLPSCPAKPNFMKLVQNRRLI